MAQETTNIKMTPMKRKHPDQPRGSSGRLEWDDIMKKLDAKHPDLALSTISELRNNMEVVHSTGYHAMLSTVIPSFVSLLKLVPITPAENPYATAISTTMSNIKPSPEKEAADKKASTNHKIRNSIMELCGRLPQNDVLGPFVPSLFNMAMGVLRQDYEDNALLAARIVFELHKNYRHILRESVQPFFDFVMSSYRNVGLSIQYNFAPLIKPIPTPDHVSTATSNALDTVVPSASTATATELTNAFTLKASNSFRVITELPVSIMLLFQLYPQLIKGHMMKILPLMMDSLAQQYPNRVCHSTLPSASKNTGNEEATEEEKRKALELERNYSRQQLIIEKLYKRRVCELLAAQAKALSFVTYVLRGYGDQMKSYEHRLASSVLNLFQICPRDAISTRKDLLTALKHIISTNFRKIFFAHITTLLDEKVLLGKFRPGEHTQLRTMAYNALAELLHHARAKLTMAQISKVVHTYSRVLHDTSIKMPLVVQMNSLRLLLNMVEPVYHNKEEVASKGRDILYRILETFTMKLQTLVDYGIERVEGIEQDRLHGKNKSDSVSTSEELNISNDQQKETKRRREQMYYYMSSDSPDTIHHVLDLTKQIISGHRNLIWCINNYGAQREKNTGSKEKNADKSKSSKQQKPSSWHEEIALQTLNVSERALLDKYIFWTIKALQVYRSEYVNDTKNSVSTQQGTQQASSKPHHEALESFAASLAVLDSYNFHRIVGPRMELLVTTMIQDEETFVIATSLLQSSNVTSEFTSCLLDFLINRMDYLDTSCTDHTDKKIQGSVTLQLFEAIFNSISKFTKNEAVLRPRLQLLIASCLRRATANDVDTWPSNYIQLLRSLFRSIAGGKFEESYKEILPLLPTLLNGLYRIYSVTFDDTLRNSIIELCLTVPARLSSLLPHLSLLIRVIVPALQTDSKDLNNLGLRTLEFWIDNLNFEFLFPILSQDSALFSELMAALSNHLRPAPYHYGLLTSRILGKLGGKNRHFLQEPMNLDPYSNAYHQSPLRIHCAWPSLGYNDVTKNSCGSIGGEKNMRNVDNHETYQVSQEVESNNRKRNPSYHKCSLPLPLEHAVKVLEMITSLPGAKLKEEKVESSTATKMDSRNVWTSFSRQFKVEDFNMKQFENDLLDATKERQAHSAFIIIRSALSAVLDMSDDYMTDKDQGKEEEENSIHRDDSRDNGGTDAIALKLVGMGLFYATIYGPLKEEAVTLLEGLVTHMILSVERHSCDVSSICQYECDTQTAQSGTSDSQKDEKGIDSPTRDTHISGGKLQPLCPFGQFVFTGALKQSKIDYFIINEIIADALAKRNDHLTKRALNVITHIASMSTRPGMRVKDEKNIAEMFIENLLYTLCQKCLSSDWNSRDGVFHGICHLLTIMDHNWCCKFDVELMHVGLFSLKDSAGIVTQAERQSLLFYFKILYLLYGWSDSWPSESSALVYDVLSIPKDPLVSDGCDTLKSAKEPSNSKIRKLRRPASDHILVMLIGELISVHHVVRFAVRHAIEHIYGGEGNAESNPSLDDLLTKSSSVIKRQLFSRSLRNLPLADQIATIETFAYVMKRSPGLVALSDNQVLRFISELLKMLSVADGEMAYDSISHSVIIDKDGFRPRSERNDSMVNKFSSLSHASGLFLREEFVMEDPYICGNIVVPAALPIGIQYRVSALVLFRNILQLHSNVFAEAEANSSIGNIFPHIATLLFRSIISRPKQAVIVAHFALRDVLSITTKSRELKGESRKKLLHTCMRPILLQLRDFKSLTTPLLKGLYRLQSLLASWFTKSLGEKLLEHLHKWSDPEIIINARQWKRGEEPLVAATMISLFELLPGDSSFFVEPLVKITLQLEAVLPRYKALLSESPFRKPLAKYLNNHGSTVVSFFINERRLKNPIYSDLFQDILRRKEASALRAKLSTKECSNILLNLCFERPLAIIRSEKGGTSSSNSGASSRMQANANPSRDLSLYGIELPQSVKRQREIFLRQDYELKQSKLQMAKQEEAKALDVHKLLAAQGGPRDNQKSINDAQRRLRKHKATVESIQKQVATAHKEYTNELSKSQLEVSKSSEDPQKPRAMTFDSLELQHQCFTLIETLIQCDDEYICQHHDVVRACRWLWRSKGRHFRLIHEDSLPARYNSESRVLARFLVSYYKIFPQDPDVLFDLLRIFLQPSTTDFEFIRVFLKEMVCKGLSVDQKKRVMDRFFAVIASESNMEELKALSIQLLVMPMLKYDLEIRSSSRVNTKPNMELSNKGDGDERSAPVTDESKDEATETYMILDKDQIKKIVRSVLINNGKFRLYGPRLSVELLKVSSLLIEFMSEDISDYHADLLKFSLTLMKNDDVFTKQWAHINASLFVAAFDTSPKIVCQLYVSLLRSHQQEAKGYTVMALDILVPVLSSRLSEGDHSKAMNYTVTVLYEEGNSLPQLSHVLRTIIRHEKAFYKNKEKFVKCMITSLSKLGLPSNSSEESRELSLSVVELLLNWNKQHENDVRSQSLPDSNHSHESPRKKSRVHEKIKPFSLPTSGLEGPLLFSLPDLKTIINFLVRLILLASSADKSQQTVIDEANALFCRIMSRWTMCEIDIKHFEKVISMCTQEAKTYTHKIKSDATNNSKACDSKEVTSRSGKPLQSQGNKPVKNREALELVSCSLLSSCLDIFIHTLDLGSENDFLFRHGIKLQHILGPCFQRATDKDREDIRQSLRQFIVALSRREKVKSCCIFDTAKAHFENLISRCLDPSISFKKISPQSGKNKHAGGTKEKEAESLICVTNFVLLTIEEISLNKIEYPHSFVFSLISLAEKLSNDQGLTKSSKSRNASTASYSSASPLVAIFEKVCRNEKTFEQDSKSSTNRKTVSLSSQKLRSSKENDCLVCCLRLIGNSSVPYSFTDSRTKFFAILYNILEVSVDVRLLLAVTMQLGLWMTTKENRVPMTKQEKNAFISRLIDLDSHCLPELESQPLFHAISYIILSSQSRKGTVMEGTHTEVESESSRKHFKDNTKGLLRKGLVSCLLSSNLSLRPLLNEQFVSGVNNEKIQGYRTKNWFEHSDMTGHNHESILRLLLASDFEGLGRRLWTFLFVDLLLGASIRSGGVKKKFESKATNKSSNDQSTLLGSALPEDAMDTYKVFREVVISEQVCDGTGRGRCIAAIRSLVSCDITLCQHLLEILLPSAWENLSDNKIRVNISQKIETLLTRSYHSQFMIGARYRKECARLSLIGCRETNVVQSLIRAVASFNPSPMISNDVLLSLATDYNCWHEVRSILENQYSIVGINPTAIGKAYIEELTSSIRKCYLELGERDIWMTMNANDNSFPGAKKAISLDLYGKVEQALSGYTSLIDEIDTAQASHDLNKIPSDMEVSFWEDRWVSLNRELGQWEVLADYAEDTCCSKLLMECAWKSRNWEKVRSLCSSPSIISALEAGDFEVKMSEIFLAIADGKLNEVENLHAQSAQLCLYKWQLLPSFFSGCNAHASLLHQFHRLVDIRESGQIMVETSTHSNGKTCPDLKNLLSAWRHRLPNDSDPMSWWEDIFQWRFHMFTAITTNFHWAEQGTLATLHDRPWTSIRLAKTARKQGMMDAALVSLGKLTDCAMDVSDAHARLREQILSYRNGSDLERTGGLNLINTTNLSYFDACQKSELFRLKGEFLESLGARTKATQSYCHAVQICPSYARAWTSWGGLCHTLADLVERQNQMQSTGKTPVDAEKASSNAKKVVQYLAQSMACYLESLQCKSSDTCRSNIPRCLLMVSKDGQSPGLLCSTFEKYATKLPSWIWMAWMPQLLSSLCRIESRVTKILLLNVISTYPQAVYFPLRSFYLERRDLERSRSSSSGDAKSSVSHAEELVTILRKSHPSLWVSLEYVLDELIHRFRPSCEEELLATINALLKRAISQNGNKESDEDAIKTSFSKTLSRVSSKFFRVQEDNNQAPKDERGRKSAEFTRRYKDSFENDFFMVTPVGEERQTQLTLTDIIQKLRKWKRILDFQVSSTPSVMPLMQVSPSLSSFSSVAPDLWPGACEPSNTSISTKGKVEDDNSHSQAPLTSSSSAAAAAAAAAISRACAYEGGGGHFGGGSACVEIPGQYSPNILRDGKPSPELHPKLLKFESTVVISRRNDQLVRRIGMVGSDGKKHQFLLQFAIPYWTRTDERTAQLHQFFSKILRKEIISSRRNLWLKPTPVIPIAQRLRMTAEEESHTSLDHLYKEYCYENGNDPGYAYELFEKLSKEDVAEKKDQECSKNGDEVRLNAYNTVCEEVVSSRILAKSMQKSLVNAESYFHFQRSFASQLALNSLLQYAFHVDERSASKFIFNKRSGQVLSPDFTFSYSNQGYVDEKKKIPFRLTRNISEFVGENMLRGVFVPVMASAASAICHYKKDIAPALQLLCRDDIVSWYLSKSAQRDGNQRTTQDLERQLADRISKNVSVIQGRLTECAVDLEKDKGDCIDNGVKKLVGIATNVEKLASMPASYSAWL